MSDCQMRPPTRFALVATLLLLAGLGIASSRLAADEPPAAAAPDSAQDNITAKLPGTIYVQARLGRIVDARTVRERGCYAVEPNTGTLRLLAANAGGLRPSPDGKRIAISTRVQQQGEVAKDEVQVLNAETLQTEHVVEGGNLPVWSDNNRLLYNIGGADGLAEPFRGWLGKTSVFDLATKQSRGLALPETVIVTDVSADGKWLVAMTNHDSSGKNYQICVMRPDGSDRQGLTAGEGMHIHPRFSPDAKQIIYCHWNNWELEVVSLWMVGRDGQNRRKLLESVNGNGAVDCACWSPDGRWIAVVRLDYVERGESRRVRGEFSNHRLEIVAPAGESRGIVEFVGAGQIQSLSQVDWR